MAYEFNADTYGHMVDFEKTAARDIVQQSRVIIDTENCPDYKKHLVYQTVNTPSQSRELASPGTTTYQYGMISLSDNYVPVWAHVRAFKWGDVEEKANAEEVSKGRTPVYQTLISEIIRQMQEFEEYMVFDGVKHISTAYVDGATGWIGAATNTATATAAWDLSTANIHQDIMKMLSKLNGDSIQTKSNLYLLGPKEKMTYMRGVTSLGIPIFNNISTSFPMINGYIDSAFCTADTACLVAKNPLYAKLVICENYSMSAPIPIPYDDRNYIIKIRFVFALKVRETNAACKMTI
jgi:uncharacterized linocin/CFP29 family protein